MDSQSKLPHPDAPAARLLAFNDVKKKGKVKFAPAPPRVKPANDDALRANVKARAEELVGKKVVGDGECYALADHLLESAAGNSADRYGTITPDADYVWGKEVSDLSNSQPGDVLQFRDHEITIETVTVTKRTSPDGAWTEKTETKTETHTRGHHTAIISSKNADGTLTVVEQHVKDPTTGKLSHVVRRNTLYISDSHEDKPIATTVQGKIKVEKKVTINITVTGKIRAYSPELKP